VLLGAFAAERLAWQGAVVQMLAHGLSTGALFAVAGIIQARLHTRDLRTMGGLWTTAPLLGGLTVAFVMSSAGLPGLGDFVGELLVLLGVYRTNVALAVVASLGMIAGAIYALKIVQDAFHGANVRDLAMRGLASRERAMLLVMLGGLLWLGLSPRAVTAALTQAAPAQPATTMATHPRVEP
jgi:NADH-quinone oxidoreductase subunit M